MRTPGGSPRSPTSLRRGTQQSPPKLDDFLGRITKKVAAVSLDFAQYGGHRGSEWAWGVSCVLMWSPTLAHILCAAAGTTSAAPAHRGHAAVPELPRYLQARVAKRAGREHTGGEPLPFAVGLCTCTCTCTYTCHAHMNTVTTTCVSTCEHSHYYLCLVSCYNSKRMLTCTRTWTWT